MPEQKTINIDITYFDDLKKTMKGKNNQYFLVNDKNQENTLYDPATPTE